MWVAPKSWPSNSSEYATSSSPMKQAARTAKACMESSIFIASLVVTASPAIDCFTVDMADPLIRAALGPAGAWLGGATLRRLFEDAWCIELVFGPVQHQRVGVHGGRVRRIEVA